MAHSIERTCDTCGGRCFAAKNAICPLCLTGILRRVVVPLPKKRLAGVLCRDDTEIGLIRFFLDTRLTNVFLSTASRVWNRLYGSQRPRNWTVEDWTEQYGTLPRKGTKEAVILELTNDR